MCESLHGELIAVFRRSFYVRFGASAVCFGSSGLGHAPLNVLCRMPDTLSWNDQLANGTTATRDGAVLLIGRRLRFDFSRATLWQAPIATGVSVPIIRAGLSRLTMAVRRHSPAGLGKLLAVPLAPVNLCGEATSDLLLRSATPIIAALSEWIAAALGGSLRPPPAIAELIGLGPGLTPSGDDFLCGAMAALHYLGHNAVARLLAEHVLSAAANATNFISASYLRWAAAGEVSEVLFDVLRSIASGGDELDACLDVVDGVGHTSGWDTLTGAAVVCAALCAAKQTHSS
ncbi:MAG: DUF2877 domain-containing protein [Xanthobacteraceae bacterium]